MALSDALLTQGATLSFKISTTEYLNAKITSFDGPDGEVNTVDSTSLEITDECRTFIKGLINHGIVSAEIEFDPDMVGPTTLRSPLRAGVGTLKITWPKPAGVTNAATWSCSAIWTKYQPKTPLDDKLTATVAFKISGDITFVLSS